MSSFCALRQWKRWILRKIRSFMNSFFRIFSRRPENTFSVNKTEVTLRNDYCRRTIGANSRVETRCTSVNKRFGCCRPLANHVQMLLLPSQISLFVGLKTGCWKCAPVTTSHHNAWRRNESSRLQEWRGNAHAVGSGRAEAHAARKFESDCRFDREKISGRGGMWRDDSDYKIFQSLNFFSLCAPV